MIQYIFGAGFVSGGYMGYQVGHKVGRFHTQRQLKKAAKHIGRAWDVVKDKTKDTAVKTSAVVVETAGKASIVATNVAKKAQETAGDVAGKTKVVATEVASKVTKVAAPVGETAVEVATNATKGIRSKLSAAYGAIASVVRGKGDEELSEDNTEEELPPEETKAEEV